MGQLSVLLTVLATLSVFEIDASLIIENYVTPSQAIGCSVNWSQNHSCLTLQEYAREPGMYFTNNTIFYFEPGSHTLNISLKLVNVHNFTFLGLPDYQLDQVSFLYGESVKITWEKCRNIRVSSITFNLLGSFTYSFVFHQTQNVLLYNISVTSRKKAIGCSSIMCQQSDVTIRNCYFFGIRGSLGAALMIIKSNASFIGNNIFIDNRASYYGGSLGSTNGNSIQGSGGAIYCKLCALIINTASIFIKNSAQNTGGAIAAVDGLIVIRGSIFKNNAARSGGAMAVYNVSSFLYGQISFINNTATARGGALMMYRLSVETFGTKLLSNVEFGAAVAVNKYDRVASLVHGIGSNSSSVGNITFLGNEARWGGAIRSIDNSEIVVENVYLNFINNKAIHGGAIYMADTSKLILTPAITISFILNHANGKGGAIYVGDSQCSLGSTIPIECFLSISNYAAANISLLFLNNSAGVIGSTLYGGQLNKCRLYYGTNYSRDKTSCNNDYSDDALGFFMNISKIDIQYDESESAMSNISSKAKQIKFCHDEKMLDNRDTLDLKLHPGEHFNIAVIGLDQAGYPTPTTLLNQNKYTDNIKYGLHPLNQPISINGLCSNVTLQYFFFR